ncbi:transmembrane protein 135-like isoform X3 [Branchiostoma lanceolatum]|uniref:transmembrane protein 135-like isoform X3 n=1 Tax=Branchiostoma lanceolatum TaxID=7740 RepID=UPI003453295F
MAAHSKSLKPIWVLKANCYEIGHTWNPSCIRAILDILLGGIVESVKIYAPVYVVTGLARRRSKRYWLYKFVPELLQSAVFLGTNAGAFIGCFCLSNKLTGMCYWHNGVTCGTVGSLLAISIERKDRRGMLAVYMFNVALETLCNMAISRGLITPRKHIEVLLFSLTAAGYAYLFRCFGGLSGIFLKGFRFLLGPEEAGRPSDARSLESEANRSLETEANKSLETEANRPATQSGKHSAWKQNLTVSRIMRLLKAALVQRHALCVHKHSCARYCLQGFARMFGMGYAAQAALRVVSSLQAIIRSPGRLLSCLFNKGNLKLGAFLGGFVGIFKFVSCFLRWIRDQDSELHAIPAGFLAGLCMFFYPSWTISLYLTLKLGELLYMKGIDTGHVPCITHADSLLFAVSTAVVLHACVMEPHNVKPSYWTFIQRLTRQRFGMMNRRTLDAYGTHASKLMPDFKPQLDPRYCLMKHE